MMGWRTSLDLLARHTRKLQARRQPLAIRASAPRADRSRREEAIRGVGPLNGVGVEIRFTPGLAGSVDPQPLGIATIPWDSGVWDTQHLVMIQWLTWGVL